jgi:hypothetical protein
MPKYIDITGRRFGQLIVLHFAGRQSRPGYQTVWLCRCDCGIEKTILGANLRHGRSNSCGKHKNAHNRTHNESNQNRTPEYASWIAMRDRCRNPNNKAFKWYGGRGIKVCERWDKFENFISDVGRKPSPKHSLDRINTNGPYSPENCKWSTQSEQVINRRKIALETLTDAELLTELHRREIFYMP